MERENQIESSPGRRGWEAMPRDGPAVLLVNARMIDESRGLVGGWVELSQPRDRVVEQIGRIVGSGGDVRDFAIVDQVGLGSTMWDEDNVGDLLGLSDEVDRG